MIDSQDVTLDWPVENTAVDFAAGTGTCRPSMLNLEEPELDRGVQCTVSNKETDMTYKFGQLSSEVNDDWGDDLLAQYTPTNPTHAHKWGRLPTEKVFEPFVYATTDIPRETLS